jgi:hypothetical protein
VIEFRFDVFNIRLTHKKKSSAGGPTWGGKESQRAAQSHFGPGTLFGIERETQLAIINFFGNEPAR